MRWTVTVDKDDFSKDYYIRLPDELLEKMDWKVGDSIKMDVVSSGLERSLRIVRIEK